MRCKGLIAAHRWIDSRDDLESTRGMVLEYLGRLPYLTDFHIVSEVDTTTLPLHYLINGSLQQLAIEHISGTLSNHKQLISSLATVFTHNPRLTHLELDYKSRLLPFQDLFYGVPSESVQLRSLTLRGWSIRVTPQVWPHLQSLHSINFPPYFDNNQIPLWKSFATLSPGSLPLSRIVTSKVSEELLTLLKSPRIRCLEALVFERAKSDRLGQEFYNDVFPRHRHTLRELSIIPRSGGDWAIGLRNLDVFDECGQLTRLTVGLAPEEIDLGEGESDIVVRVSLSLWIIKKR